ncbi:MAG: glycogen debranching protein, partial [Pyramidobacter sp.]|nr:glycogen debranching protein [Pyramidobacter sp.]
MIAGYPWFGAWGRDTMIALPGLTFCADRAQDGLEILMQATRSMKDGQIPNMYAPDGVNHSYNSVDASLWYVWAVQQLMNH